MAPEVGFRVYGWDFGMLAELFLQLINMECRLKEDSHLCRALLPFHICVEKEARGLGLRFRGLGFNASRLKV